MNPHSKPPPLLKTNGFVFSFTHFNTFPYPIIALGMGDRKDCVSIFIRAHPMSVYWLDACMYISSVHYTQTCVLCLLGRELHSVPALPGPVLQTEASWLAESLPSVLIYVRLLTPD